MDAASTKDNAMTELAGRLIIAAIMAAIFAGSSPAFAASQPDKVCHDPLLSQYEQTLCVEQIRAAQTVAEQKQIQAKFRDRVAARKKK